MLHLMVDTCVWLDTAKDPRGERLIAAVRSVQAEGGLELLVPALVLDEFERNRDQVVSSLTTSMRSHLRTARAVLARYSPDELSERLVKEFDDAATRGPLIQDFVEGRFSEVASLLRSGRAIEIDDACLRLVAQRALEKRAPFHRAKNSVADAILVETFRQAWSGTKVPDSDCFMFVTHNTKDFSDPQDTRAPHPDLSDCFSLSAASYSVSLEAALIDGIENGADVIRESDFEEIPRSGREILQAHEELFDLIWYERSLRSMHPAGAPGRQRVEATYPPEQLGPHSDYEWGMLNGKLSALRWVMGDEWDFLDT